MLFQTLLTAGAVLGALGGGTDSVHSAHSAHSGFAPLRVVTSLTTYAAIAREIVGARGTVTAIAQGDEDPHFVQPKPSFVAMLRDADLFVTTGLDLELWVPPLLDRANNRQVIEGGAGYVTAYTGIHLLEIPSSTDRSQGDIHAEGNPHIHTDPINGILIARNILTGLKRVAPGDADFWTAREQDFEHRVLAATVGEELVRLLTPGTTFDLLRNGTFHDFVNGKQYQGRPLRERLGGWFKKTEVLRGKEMVCYHREWVYFSDRFGIPCVAFVEPKPGIPPTPRHVREVISLMQTRHIPVLFSANYYPRSAIEQVARKTGATAVVVPENTGGAPGVESYFDLVDSWVNGLTAVFK